MKWVLINRGNPDRVEQVSIHKTVGNETWYDEMPKDTTPEFFDKSDLKFIAVSLAHSEIPPIVNTTDTDWLKIEDILLGWGIKVEFLCREELKQKYLKKNRC